MICPGNFRRLPGRGGSFVAPAAGDGAEPRPALPSGVEGGWLDQFGSAAGGRVCSLGAVVRGWPIVTAEAPGHVDHGSAGQPLPP